MQNAGEVQDSPSPVMTFQVAGVWLAVRVEQMDRIAFAERLWSVPLSRPEYLGLMDDNSELVPVLRLGKGNSKMPELIREQVVAILHVRGESVGLAVDNPGRVYDEYRVRDEKADLPAQLGLSTAISAHTSDNQFWLIDPDHLWQHADSVADLLTPNV